MRLGKAVKKQKTPLSKDVAVAFAAVRNKDLAALRRAIEQGVDPNAKDEWRESLLLAAVQTPGRNEDARRFPFEFTLEPEACELIDLIL